MFGRKEKETTSDDGPSTRPRAPARGRGPALDVREIALRFRAGRRPAGCAQDQRPRRKYRTHIRAGVGWVRHRAGPVPWPALGWRGRRALGHCVPGSCVVEGTELDNCFEDAVSGARSLRARFPGSPQTPPEGRPGAQPNIFSSEQVCDRFSRPRFLGSPRTPPKVAGIRRAAP